MTRPVMTPAGRFPSLKAANDAYQKTLHYYFQTRPSEFYYIDEPKERKPRISTGRRNSYWYPAKGFETRMDFAQLPDPRLAVSKWIDWTQSKNNSTTWRFPEPDNLNAAVWHLRPHDIKGIEHQMWYPDQQRGGWFSCYYIGNELEQQLFDAYVAQGRIWSYWRYPDAARPRHYMSSIERDIDNTVGKNKAMMHTLDERLSEMGFLDNLEQKGISKAFIKEHIGQVRTHLRSIETIVEDEDYD